MTQHTTAIKHARKYAHLIDLVQMVDGVAEARPEVVQAKFDQVFDSSPMLKTTWKMRQELTRLWERSTLSTEQLVHQLKDWCERAEKSDVPHLVAFSRRLRYYA